MRIKAGFEIAFGCDQPTAALLMLSIEPAREKDLLTAHEIVASPAAACRFYLDGYGNRVLRTLLAPGKTTFSCSFVIKDTGQPDLVAPAAQECPIEQLPDD